MNNLVVRRRNNLRTMDPWKEMDRFFGDYSRDWDDEPRKPVVRIENEESRVVLTAELPGFGPEDIDIQIEENLLTLKALKRGEKKKDGDKVVFEKSFVLSDDLKRDGVEARMKNGLLTLELSRKEKPAPLTIRING